MNYKIRKGVLKRYKDEKNVTEIFIPDSVGIIGEGAFNGCTNLVRILIPETVKVISDTAFSDCENLRCIALPEGTERLGWYAFKGCHNLRELTLPSALKEIGRYAFAGCENLTAVHVRHDGRIYRFVLNSELDDERWQEIRRSFHQIDKAIAV
ncbi:leucine-rich repeat domain-containing protein [Ruminococcus sp.]|uniref:leucine-rich repeat domain-containing protein n=1 Tax=Ruminococcus sp. TaxID=41978 RepID=UPI001B6B8090|nr:leucine-rich repeat domain-containing protein [Ruminococcus sp.]MBP5431308.1 leucine-rich repeat domain-containing protein [Ruminococcus sp.]